MRLDLGELLDPSYRILGPLEVATSTGPLTIPGRRQRALLAVLLLHANETIPVEILAEAMWPDRRPADPGNAVQSVVSRLRRALGERGGAGGIETRAGGYRLRVAPESVDLARFEARIAGARSEVARGRLREAAALFREAEDLWTGQPLTELGPNPYFDRELGRLGELRMAALEDRVENDLALGRHRLLVPELGLLVSETVARERLWAAFALALYRSDRQADALAALRDMRRSFVDGLGIEPGSRIRELERSILTQDGRLAPPAASVAADAVQPPAGLVGRDQELDAICELLRQPDVRLVTLSGAGGIGKSTLARAAVHALRDQFGGGALIVEAGAAQDSSSLALAIAEQVADASDPERGIMASLVARLQRAPALLMLDNIEQLRDDLSVVTHLLAEVPTLTLLVTSRVALRLSSEREVVVPPLELPPQDDPRSSVELLRYPSSALFLERCRRTTPSFRLRSDDLRAVVEICHRLDGVPLALELAAACLKMLTLPEIAQRLDTSLSILTRGRRDAPERQQTMRATVEWSYRLLDARERDLLARLAVFNGGWTLTAAESVCGGDVLDGCAALIDANLIRRAEGAERRFRMLVPVREFSLELLDRLPDAESLRRRHAEHYADTLFAACNSGRRLEYAVADLAAAELGNLRAALQWCLVNGHGQPAVKLGCSLASFCRVRGHTDEARGWLERVLAACADAPAATRATAMLELAGLANFQDDFAASEPLLRGVVELAEIAPVDGRDLLDATGTLAWVHAATGRHRSAIELTERAMELARHRDPLDLASAINGHALTLAELGMLEEATRMLERGLEVSRKLDSRRGLVAALTNLSVLKICMGALDEAEALIDECIVLAQHHADAVLHACAASNLAMIHLLRGDTGQLVAKLLDALHRNERLVDRRGMIENALVAAAAASADRDSEALVLYAACSSLHDRIGFQLSPGEVLVVDRYLAPLVHDAGAERWGEAAELGAMLDLPATVEMARRLLAEIDERARDRDALVEF